MYNTMGQEVSESKALAELLDKVGSDAEAQRQTEH